jgi:cytochrome c nitrite reductase small subunit
VKLSLFISVLALAITLGVGIYVTDFPAYLGNDPATCNRCHVMDSAYEGWFHAGHRSWTVCNDCHTPQSFIPHYLYKGYAGTRDVVLYTLNLIPRTIRADGLTRAIVQENCLRCHGATVMAVGDGQPDAGRACVACHRTVAHGERGAALRP